jgi:hypothetical protein
MQDRNRNIYGLLKSDKATRNENEISRQRQQRIIKDKVRGRGLQSPVTGAREHDNESVISLKGGEPLYQLSNHQLLSSVLHGVCCLSDG